MVDNVAITAGTGTSVAADDIAGVMHQRVKLGLGADGTAVDAIAGAGAVGTGVQRVTLASDDPAVAALQIIDNAIAGNEMQVDVLTLPALVAGTAAIGKLAANSGVDIGDVDVTSSALPTGAATSANQTTIIGHVDGIETLLTTQATYLDGLETAIASSNTKLDTIITNSTGATPAGTNNIGDVDVLTIIPGVGATNLGKAEDAAHTTGDTGVAMLSVRRDVAASGAGTDGDYATLNTDASGRLYVTSPALANIGAGEYETVAASQTAQTLGATGATGDYIAGILVIPATTSPGVVTLLDNAISIPVFVGGASSLSNLVPFLIPLGLISVSGAWKITTGANVSCVGIGNFT